MRSRGFTLIELLIVVALTAILAALAVPGFTQFFAKRSVQSAAAALASDYRFARSEAIKRSSYVTACRSTDGATCADAVGSWHTGWIVFSDRDADHVVDADDLVLRVQQALPGISSMQSLTPSATDRYITFRPNGIAVAAAGNLVVASSATPSHTRLLCISMQGRVAMRAEGDLTCS